MHKEEGWVLKLAFSMFVAKLWLLSIYMKLPELTVVLSNEIDTCPVIDLQKKLLWYVTVIIDSLTALISIPDFI